ncbi:MAG: membrane-bound serine protease (ClpP class) [Planctomycetota bacterium]|jgi:membrane-bound serine protease (ClpP class)
MDQRLTMKTGYTPQRFLAHAALILATLCTVIIGSLHAQGNGEGRELVIKEKYKRVVLVRLGKNRVVDETLYEQVAKAIEAQAPYENVALIFEIDSGGGRVDSARLIVDLIRSHRESEKLRIIAYVPVKAYSAAAWMAFACKGLIIASEATIGDIQPIIRDFRGYERAPEKIVTALTEEFRLSCQSNGLKVRYPRLFLEAMVDKDIEIVAVDNSKLGTTDYLRADDWRAMRDDQKDGLTPNFIGLPEKALTTHGRELLDFGFTVKLMDGSYEELIDILGAPGVDLQVEDVIQPRPFEFSKYIPSFSWEFLLLIAGIVLLVLELKTPGLGIFGIGGILALVAFFLVRAGFSDAALWPLSLFLVGIFLIIVEVVILPGLLAPGIAGLCLILYATWSAVAHPGATDLPPFPDLGDPGDSASVRLWASSLVGGLCGGFAFTFILGKFLHNLPILNKLVAVTSRSHVPTPAKVKSNNGIDQGTRGNAVTDLCPGGTAMIDGKRINVVTKGQFVDSGANIVVTGKSGNRIVVKEIKVDQTP